jgi:hypothetical protein
MSTMFWCFFVRDELETIDNWLLAGNFRQAWNTINSHSTQVLLDGSCQTQALLSLLDCLQIERGLNVTDRSWFFDDAPACGKPSDRFHVVLSFTAEEARKSLVALRKIPNRRLAVREVAELYGLHRCGLTPEDVEKALSFYEETLREACNHGPGRLVVIAEDLREENI